MAINSATQKTTNGVCTSSTRPTSPYVGQMIYETDTNLLKIYTSAGWTVGQSLS